MNKERAMETAAQLMQKANAAMRTLAVEFTDRGERFALFNAGTISGDVRFGLFPRDLLTTGLILRDPEILGESVRFAAHTIGTTVDPKTGEEPGRVMHEWNRVERNGLLSRYNACETSQLLLIAACVLLQAGTPNDLALLERLGPALVSAGLYVEAHIEDGLFVEDPRRCGAERYFAQATYWKDSHLPGHREIAYPVSYALVQAQTVCALRALAALSPPLALGRDPAPLLDLAHLVAEKLWTSLWDEEKDLPVIAVDRVSRIVGISSDALHALAYLEPDDVPPIRLERTREISALLETPYGYRTYAPGQTDYEPGAYHLGSIWPFEQALIARGAGIFGLGAVLEGASRVLLALEALGFPELLVWDGRSLSAGGCDVQLWTCATPRGFLNVLSRDQEEER